MSKIFLGKNQRRMFDFLTKVNGWHGIAKDRATKEAAKGLVKKGLIEINEYNQARVISK